MLPSAGIKREQKSECIVLSQDRMADSDCVFVAVTIDSLNQKPSSAINVQNFPLRKIHLSKKDLYKILQKDTTFKKSFKPVKRCLKTLDMKIMSKHITFP